MKFFKSMVGGKGGEKADQEEEEEEVGGKEERKEEEEEEEGEFEEVEDQETHYRGEVSAGGSRKHSDGGSVGSDQGWAGGGGSAKQPGLVKQRYSSSITSEASRRGGMDTHESEPDETSMPAASRRSQASGFDSQSYLQHANGRRASSNMLSRPGSDGGGWGSSRGNSSRSFLAGDDAGATPLPKSGSSTERASQRSSTAGSGTGSHLPGAPVMEDDAAEDTSADTLRGSGGDGEGSRAEQGGFGVRGKAKLGGMSMDDDGADDEGIDTERSELPVHSGVSAARIQPQGGLKSKAKSMRRSSTVEGVFTAHDSEELHMVADVRRLSDASGVYAMDSFEVTANGRGKKGHMKNVPAAEGVFTHDSMILMDGFASISWKDDDDDAEGRTALDADSRKKLDANSRMSAKLASESEGVLAPHELEKLEVGAETAPGGPLGAGSWGLQANAEKMKMRSLADGVWVESVLNMERLEEEQDVDVHARYVRHMENMSRVEMREAEEEDERERQRKLIERYKLYGLVSFPFVILILCIALPVALNKILPNPGCDPGYYFGKAPHDKIYNLKDCNRCPAGTFSVAGSVDMSSCFCNGGFYGENLNCTACDRGLWAPTEISKNRTDCLPMATYWRVAKLGQTCEAACRQEGKLPDMRSLRVWESNLDGPVDMMKILSFNLVIQCDDVRISHRSNGPWLCTDQDCGPLRGICFYPGPPLRGDSEMTTPAVARRICSCYDPSKFAAAAG